MLKLNHSKSYWYFSDLSDSDWLHSIGTPKVNLKSAWMTLKTLTSSKIQIIYPLPWNVVSVNSQDLDFTDVDTQLMSWLDFYIEALAIKQEYPSRVSLVPVDCLKSSDQGTSALDRLYALVWEYKHPDAFELLEHLESFAANLIRAPFVRKNAFDQEADLLLDVEGLLSQYLTLDVRLNDQSKVDSHELSRLQDLLAELEDVKNKLAQTDDLLEQQQKVAESYSVQLQVLQLERDDLTKVAKNLRFELDSVEQRLIQENDTVSELRLQLERAAPASADLATRDTDLQRIRELEAELRETREESDLLLAQLHKVQEELEIYYLELQEYRSEAVLATGTLLDAQKRITRLQ